jgi:hypothetical protein
LGDGRTVDVWLQSSVDGDVKWRLDVVYASAAHHLPVQRLQLHASSIGEFMIQRATTPGFHGCCCGQGLLDKVLGQFGSAGTRDRLCLFQRSPEQGMNQRPLRRGEDPRGWPRPRKHLCASGDLCQACNNRHRFSLPCSSPPHDGSALLAAHAAAHPGPH